jgi:deoxycytidylate deaminase
MELTKKDRAYFNIAKEVSKLSDFPRVQIGTCAVYKHKVISTGCNSQRTSPLQKKYNQYRFTVDTNHSCHAEISCLKPLIGRKDIDFKNIELYIYREYKNGQPGIARPCPSCMRLISELGIKHIYYTNSGGFSHEEILI